VLLFFLLLFGSFAFRAPTPNREIAFADAFLRIWFSPCSFLGSEWLPTRLASLSSTRLGYRCGKRKTRFWTNRRQLFH